MFVKISPRLASFGHSNIHSRLSAALLISISSSASLHPDLRHIRFISQTPIPFAGRKTKGDMAPKAGTKHERSASQEDLLRHPSAKKAKEIDGHTPMQELNALLEKQDESHNPRNVLHWFRSKDIRMEDNKGLQAASAKAKEGKGHLITMYLFSPKDFEWHGTSPARMDFILQSLELLKKQLAEKHIPLAVVVAEERGAKVSTVMNFIKEHDISHVFANLEYEVDELRRDIKFAKQIHEEKDVSFMAFHDQTVIEPGELKGNAGPMKVFTPYHKAWVAEIAGSGDWLNTMPDPEANDASASKDLKALFDSKLPDLPESKKFASTEDQNRIRKLWPAGHAAAKDRLDNFLKKKVGKYAEYRSDPSKDLSSRLSPYFAAGILSVREALTAAAKANETGHDFSEKGHPGIASWVREVAFREFYRQTLVITPHDSMNLPHNLKFDNVKWEDDEEGWKKWCDGTTGMPLVDAGMRQLKAEAFMHNRARMNTSSYLRTNLLIDYRRGERFFVENLIDWDLANNTQGWEPSYTVFNPVSQAERNDPNGDYIRKWVPELKDVKGKEVFDPANRMSKAAFEKLGYPRPHVEFSETKDRCIERYKEAIRTANV